MQLHELFRERIRLRPRRRLDDGVATDDFFRFGKRAVGPGQLAALRPDAVTLFGTLQPGGLLQNAALEAVFHELTHCLVEVLGVLQPRSAFSVLDQHQKLHDSSIPRRDRAPSVTYRTNSPRIDT